MSPEFDLEKPPPEAVRPKELPLARGARARQKSDLAWRSKGDDTRGGDEVPLVRRKSGLPLGQVGEEAPGVGAIAVRES